MSDVAITLLGAGLIIVAAVTGFAHGLDAGTPVFDITEVVYTANPYRMRGLDGVVCYISPNLKLIP